MTTAADRLGPTAWTIAVLGVLYYVTPLVQADYPDDLPWVLPMVVVAVLALAVLRLAPQRPVGVAVALAVLWIVAAPVFGPAIVAQERVSATRRRRDAALTAVLLLLGKVGDTAWHLAETSGLRTANVVELTFAVFGLVVATLVGWLRRSTADQALRAREADAARREADQARVNEARLAERERIAREMHDVVAHRISLIALHSGALAHRMADAAPDEAELARLIQANAQASLTELRGVLRTLRGADAPPEPPQPGLADLDALVADARAAGQQVETRVDGDLAAVPARVSRHAYRIVQEGLTNALKHAPGAPVTLTVTASDDLRLRVANPLADLAAPDRTGSGLGLVGIVERVEQLGGEVTHGVRDGRFTLEVALPGGDA